MLIVSEKTEAQLANEAQLADFTEKLGKETLGWLQGCTVNNTEPAPPQMMAKLIGLMSDEAFLARDGACAYLGKWLGGRLDNAQVRRHCAPSDSLSLSLSLSLCFSFSL